MIKVALLSYVETIALVSPLSIWTCKPVPVIKPTNILHSREKFMKFLRTSKTTTKTFHHFLF